MIYAEIVSELADHLFIYAFARSLQLKYKNQEKDKIAFDYRNFTKDPKIKEYIFDYKCGDNLVLEERKLNLIQRLALNIYCRNRDKAASKGKDWEYEVKYRELMSIFGIYICTYNYHEFKHKPLFKNILLLGFFHGKKFFEDFDEDLRKEYKPKLEEFTPYVKGLLDRINNSNSVCMHIRRGEFTDEAHRNNLLICNNDYFYKGVEIIKSKVENPKMFISTDDMEWVKTLDFDIDYEVIDFNQITTPINLYVMSRCKHFIVSNSGYSWWAQHLSDNKDKIVIAPNKWTKLNPEKNTDLFEGDWTLINVD